MSAVIGLVNSSLLLVLKKRWGRLFSSDDKVVKIVADVVSLPDVVGRRSAEALAPQIPLVGLFQFTDSLTGAAMGVLRGTGLAVGSWCFIPYILPDPADRADPGSQNQPGGILGDRYPHRTRSDLLQAPLEAIRTLGGSDDSPDLHCGGRLLGDRTYQLATDGQRRQGERRSAHCRALEA